MKVNKLKLNNEKTEVILLRSNNITKHIPSPLLHIDDISLEATDKVKNLGVTIDKKLSFVALTIDKTDSYTRRVMMCAVTSSTYVCFAVANFSFTMSTQLKAAE